MADSNIHESVNCCCHTPDARSCAALRSGVSEEEIDKDDECECCCHEPEWEDDYDG